jgi:hypothetical protein
MVLDVSALSDRSTWLHRGASGATMKRYGGVRQVLRQGAKVCLSTSR